MAKRTSASPPSLPIRIFRLHTKLAAAAAIGFAAAAVLLASGMRGFASVLAGWDTGVAVYLALTYAMMRRADVAHIRRRAAEQDEGAEFILPLSIVATFASLLAILIALVDAKRGPGNVALFDVGLAVTTILLSWTFVHMIFSIHYAHEYYAGGHDERIGGLEFPRDGNPDYRDFLYFSLVIGMTSQVSDVQITSKVIRRMASVHGVLSFFFNLVVLALTVNLVANLI